jgi:hypothetical protein
MGRKNKNVKKGRRPRGNPRRRAAASRDMNVEDGRLTLRLQQFSQLSKQQLVVGAGVNHCLTIQPATICGECGNQRIRCPCQKCSEACGKVLDLSRYRDPYNLNSFPCGEYAIRCSTCFGTKAAVKDAAATRFHFGNMTFVEDLQDRLLYKSGECKLYYWPGYQRDERVEDAGDDEEVTPSQLASVLAWMQQRFDDERNSDERTQPESISDSVMRSIKSDIARLPLAICGRTLLAILQLSKHYHKLITAVSGRNPDKDISDLVQASDILLGRERIVRAEYEYLATAQDRCWLCWDTRTICPGCTHGMVPTEYFGGCGDLIRCPICMDPEETQIDCDIKKEATGIPNFLSAAKYYDRYRHMKKSILAKYPQTDVAEPTSS